MLAGCSTSPAVAAELEEARSAPAAQAAPISSAGDLPTTARPDRDANAIAALRARGAEGLGQILAEYDRARPSARAALAATVDAVAAQRYATVSRLYWYTDLEAAKAEAQRRKRPILALRMLGRLDEDLSCANSRFFRTALYPDARVSTLLREQFVLLWTSERPVPRVTIDYGDGRTLVGTVTGNSIHYVLDEAGNVVDALPGLYIPQVFVRELTAARAMLTAERRAHLDGPAQRAFRQRWLQARQRAADAAFADVAGAIWIPGIRQLLTADDAASAIERAQRATAGKARVEVPLLHQIAPGTTPGDLGDGEVAQWASIGQALFGLGEVKAPAEPATPAAQAPGWGRRMARVVRTVRTGMAQASAGARPGDPPAVLDARARALVAAVYLGGQAAPGVAADAAAVLARFEQRMVADTAIGQVRLRPQIRARLMAATPPSLEELGQWVYAEVFSTPRQDPWLGLLPRDEYTGLPGDGVVVQPQVASASPR